MAESRRFWSSRAAGWLALALLIAGAFVIYARVTDDRPTGTSGGTTHQLLGSVLIFQPQNFVATGSTCSGRGALPDLVAGAPVVIRDPAGAVIAADTLEAGTVTPEGHCRLRYGVRVPEVASYAFVIGQQPPSRPVTRHLLEQAATNAGYTDGDWWNTQGYDG